MRVIQIPETLKLIDDEINYAQRCGNTPNTECLKRIQTKLLNELLEAEENDTYTLAMISRDNRIEEIEGYNLSITELSNTIFVQPLDALMEDEYDMLEYAIKAAMNPSGTRPVVIIPFDIKILKAKALIK